MSTEPNTYLILRTPERRSLWLGAICACIIPIVIGVIISQRQHYYESLVIEQAIVLTYIFGTPIVAWLSCQQILEEIPLQRLQKQRVSTISISQARTVHFYAAGMHIAYLLTMGTVEYAFLSSFGGMITALMIVLLGSIINLLLSLFITIPIAWLCSYIFSFIALKNNNLTVQQNQSRQ